MKKKKTSTKLNIANLSLAFYNQSLMNQAIATWSGGKDSTLATYKALKKGYKITHLANTISQEYRRVRFHGVTAELIQAQADAIGIPLLQTETTAKDYKKEFIDNVKRGVTEETDALIFGDIHLDDCYQWADVVSKELGLKVLEPLWHMKQTDILQEFINSGFKAVIVSTQDTLLGREWVGRDIDETFLRDIVKIKNIDACGENGEFHTFVYDGPLFEKRLELNKTAVTQRDGYNFLDIQEFKVTLR